MPSQRIVVFEDADERYTDLEAQLCLQLEEGFQVQRYPGDREASNGWQSVEGLIRTYMLEPEPAILAVIDWDLSGFRQPAPQRLVRSVAEDLSIPVALYQTAQPREETLEKLTRWQERRIALQPTADQATIAGQCADAAHGFNVIRHVLEDLGDRPRLLESLVRVLGAPDDPPLHLEQFAVGNQELLRIASEPLPSAADDRRFVSTWMGYLIYNRILQFPGPVLGTAAAAAYLCVDGDELASADVRKALDGSSYRGPFFHTYTGWWRALLDGLIRRAAREEDQTLPIGRVALERTVGRSLRPAMCRDGHPLEEPGYLCVLTDTCVCRAHSESPDAWLPQGADRCRISTDEFERLEGWLGI